MNREVSWSGSWNTRPFRKITMDCTSVPIENMNPDRKNIKPKPSTSPTSP